MRLPTALAGLLIVCVATSASARQASAASARKGNQRARVSKAQTPISEQPTASDESAHTQYPAFLIHSYFGFNVGAIRYLFSQQQLQPGYHAGSLLIPHLAVRVDLFGHQFAKYLSAQIVYMRPARFVTYQSVNGDQIQHKVSEAIGAVTLSSSIPLTRRLSVYGEGGWGITSRSGFTINGQTVVKQARFAAGLFGAGLIYHVTSHVDMLFSATYSPGRRSFEQPSTRVFTTGFRYHILPLAAAEVAANRRAGYFFPANLIRIGYSSGAPGYALNTFFSSTVPIFWGGHVRAGHGVTVDYQHDVFHTKKRFAFDVGASFSSWASLSQNDAFRTLSVYPLFRFFLFRTRPADVYATYSLAGPTYISRTSLDGQNIGAHFTFQDFMAIGAFLGPARRVDIELGIKHYSNGNIFPHNAAVRVPLTLTIGLAF